MFLAGWLTIVLALRTTLAQTAFTSAPIYTPVHTDTWVLCGVQISPDESIEGVMWYQNELFIAVIGKDGKVKYTDESLKSKYSVDANRSLIIMDVTIEDMANYTCKVFTSVLSPEFGVIERNKTTQLIIQDVPDPPGRPVVTNVTSRSVVVSWAQSITDNNSPITKYLIKIKKPEEEWDDAGTHVAENDVQEYLISTLHPYTMYHLHVISVNDIGLSQPSMDSDLFQTQAEKPSLPPYNLTATSPKSTQIEVRWNHPPDSAINGILEGYYVQYTKFGDQTLNPITVEGEPKTSVLIEGVEPFTLYIIKVRAYNNIDRGPAAITSVKTAQGAPSEPRILHYTKIRSDSFELNWEAPKNIKGILRSYQLQWRPENDTNWKTRIITGHLSNPMTARIEGLKPYTKYYLRALATTDGGDSPYSEEIHAFTDVQGPSMPILLNLTVLSADSIFVQWEEPRVVYLKVHYYFIHYWDLTRSLNNGELISEGAELQRNITNLPTNTQYRLKIAGVTNSLFTNNYYIGEFSMPVIFVLGDPSKNFINITSTTDPQAAQALEPEVMSAGALAGVVVGAFVIVLIVLLFIGYKSVTCRKYYHAAYYYFAVPTNSNTPPSTTITITTDSVEENRYPAIPVPDFIQHVKTLHADSDVGFAQEFEDINAHTRADAPSESSCSYAPENQSKNRYVNINAFDRTRVVLKPVIGRPKSADYINANYIDGYKRTGAYIATQGPLPQTFGDFWRMVWEQGSIVIVMITNLVERGRKKCDMYWPEEGTETYGSVTVKHINTFSRAHYTVRMFSLRSSKIKKYVSERIVYQYHYTEWPDHGVPDFTLPVLKFVQKSAGVNSPGAGPIVVHCSAGVGRTGTYMLIDTMIHQIKAEGTVNIPSFLLHIRKQRKYLVQTEEQYMLIHDAVAEYILTRGDTEIREHEVTNYINDLIRQPDTDKDTMLDRQYQLVTEYKARLDEMSAALKPVNRAKNRNQDIVPLNVKRVLLPVKPGVEGSDYINATYLQGYNYSNEFIVTQYPLEETEEDFWRMVWDQNSSVILLLTDGEDQEKKFWPEKDEPIEVDTGNFKLTFREEDPRKKCIIRDFLLESTQDDYILMTRIVCVTNWPHSCKQPHTVFDLVETVKELHKQNDVGPVIVVDRCGGVEAGLFCALTSLFDQLQHDRTIDVYQVCKLYHLKRPGIIGSKENYLFLYKVAESLVQQTSDKQSPGLHRLQLGSLKKNGTLPRSVTINSKIETNV